MWLGRRSSTLAPNPRSPPIGQQTVTTSDYEIRHLTEAQVDQAYPLVREVVATLSVPEWQRYAGRLLASGRGLRRESGIIAALGFGSIYFRGLCAYRIFPDLLGSDRLIAGCFAVPSTIDCETVAHELILGCRIIAEAHGCHAVHVHLVERNRWIEPLLRMVGFGADTTAYVQAVSEAGRH